MRLLKLFPPVVVVVVLVVARNSAGSIDDTFFKTCFCRRCPGDCGRGHLLYMLSVSNFRSRSVQEKGLYKRNF